jgi:hypothetical protein
MTRNYAISGALLFALLLLSSALPAQSIPRRRTVLPPELREVSGMVRTKSGELWLLNDSHNPSDLFRYDLVQGRVAEVRRLPVPNRDWEDLTTDTQGYLYVGDFGNNYNRRRDLRIYRYHPQHQTLDSIVFDYPDQRAFPPASVTDWNFNCEAMVYFRDSLHLFSKNNFDGNFYTKHYVVPARPGRYVAELRDSLHLRNRVVTGAAITDDGTTLALTGYIVKKIFGFIPFTKASVFYFTDFRNGAFLRGRCTRKRLPKLFIARQYESVTQWDGDCWITANEGRRPHLQAIWRLKRCQ